MIVLSVLSQTVRSVFDVFVDALLFCRLCLRPPVALAAENLFLRKQLGLYIERKTKPRRATDAVRFTLAELSRFFDWRNTLPDLDRWSFEIAHFFSLFSSECFVSGKHF